MANGHGGARKDAGRKPKAHLYGARIAAADKFIAPKLKEYAELIDRLARGEIDIVREVWRPAALVLVERIEMQEVDRGEETRLVPVKSKVPAFPSMRPEQMVLVEKRIQAGQVDLDALIYLQNRVMGKPAGQPEEPEEDAPMPGYDLSRLSAEDLNALKELLEKASAPASPAFGGGRGTGAAEP